MVDLIKFGENNWKDIK